jgi:2-succinyl-6-hydroxy-2,4-cyclohexadiene-1-carboxylate synthase
MPDYRAAIRAHAARLHLIVGGDDARFLAIARALVAACPALPLDVIAGAGHDVALERPAELARAIARALARLVTHPG